MAAQDYQDINHGTEWRRHLEGSTLQILISRHSHAQHVAAATQLHTYCSFFGCEGPFVLGKGCHNTWRTYSTREPAALEVCSLDLTRETFVAIFGRGLNERQNLPGEVIVYDQRRQMCVVLDSGDIAVPLYLYTRSDPVMGDFPWYLERPLLGVGSSKVHSGFNLLRPIPALICALGIWARIQIDIASTSNVAGYDQWRTQLEWRKQDLEQDILEFVYLCYSRLRSDMERVSSGDPHFTGVQQIVESYLRTFIGNDAQSEATRETLTDYFAQIGLYKRQYIGPRYDFYGTPGWNQLTR